MCVMKIRSTILFLFLCACVRNLFACVRIGCVIALAGMCLCSCNTQKVTYFQDANDSVNIRIKEKPFVIKRGDKLNIVVNSSDAQVEAQFTLTTSTSRKLLGSTTSPLTTIDRTQETRYAIAYTVDDQGDINFPILGKVPVLGKTRLEVAQYITDRLISRDLVRDPIVTVEYVNLFVSVVGEVNRPGRINIENDQMTLMEAIALVGDLKIDGDREHVLVTRRDGEINRNYIINLLDQQGLMESPVYYLQQGDVIYVAPNRKRKNESSAAANTFQTPTFWVSLGALATSVVTLIYNVKPRSN